MIIDTTSYSFYCSNKAIAIFLYKNFLQCFSIFHQWPHNYLEHSVCISFDEAIIGQYGSMKFMNETFECCDNHATLCWLSISTYKRTPLSDQKLRRTIKCKNGLHSNQGSDQSQNLKQIHICTSCILDRSGYHSMWSILRD